MKFGVIYARYSSHSQNEQTIETQIQYCENYAKEHGITIVGKYIDKAMGFGNETYEIWITDTK